MKNSKLAERFAMGVNVGTTKHMFIDGDTIYSYGEHFPIARRIAHNLYYFTMSSYSSTTRKHKALIFHALTNVGAVIVMLPNCDSSSAGIAKNVNDKLIAKFKDKLKRVRTDKMKRFYESGIEAMKKQNKLIDKYVIPTFVAEKI
jgi:hypothetical protein